MPDHVIISAEIGINHNGDVEVAKRLIDTAVLAGCDSVKFQKRTIDAVYTKAFLDSPRQSQWGTTQRAQKEGLEFNEKQYDEVDAYCRERNIAWFASAWDVGAQKFLRKYNLKYNKVASPVLTNRPLLEAVAERSLAPTAQARERRRSHEERDQEGRRQEAAHPIGKTSDNYGRHRPAAG